MINVLLKIIKSLWGLEDSQLIYYQELIRRYRQELEIDLNKKEFKYSQNGESGIIEEIFGRIGVENKSFLNFAQDTECKTISPIFYLKTGRGYG